MKRNPKPVDFVSAGSQGEASGKTDQAGKGARHKRKFSQSRFDETASTVVTRVPNKSVEDLYCLDCGPKTKVGTEHSSSTSSHSELSPGVERHQAELSPGLERPSTSSDCGLFSSASVSPDGAGCLWLEEQPEPQPVEHGMFGTIKDLSVSNIHANDKDKTSEFLSKDFHALFQTDKSSLASPSKSGTGFSAVTDRPLSKANHSSSVDDGEGLLPSRSPYPSSSPHSAFSPLDLDLDLCLPVPPAASPSLEQLDCAFLPSPPTHEPVPSWQHQHQQQPIVLLEKIHNTAPSSSKRPSSAKGRTRTRTPVALQDMSLISSTSAPEVSSAIRRSTASAGGTCGRDEDDEHVSLLEMAENLLQMTAEMHSHIHSSTEITGLAGEEPTVEDGAMNIPDTDDFPSPGSDQSAGVSASISLDVCEERKSGDRSPLKTEERSLEGDEEKSPLLPPAVATDDAEVEETEAGEEDISVSVVDTTAEEEEFSSEESASKERPSFFV